MSFQCAAYKLGANVLAYNDITSSSKKGESLEDTVK
jgi:aspartate carbamoyltransferase catalytic subunit